MDSSKSGISNVDKMVASVAGSTDNYVVKIADNQTTKTEMEKALLNKYGSLENIKYFTMDISLYDQTGTSKIEDTAGMNVNITMPLPDAMVPYAGNNKVATVTNGALDELNAKFITIDDVACVSFTAPHFSPYAVYVDTTNLSAGAVADTTPKTGDGIHPKWFLSIGLALLSIFMFLVKGSLELSA